MAKQKWLRIKKCGTILGWNPAMVKNPLVEEVELDLSKPESKPADKPKASSKKKAASRKPPSKPLVADSEEELDALLEGIDEGAENS